MEELRLMILQEIEKSQVAHDEAKRAGYKSYQQHYGNQIKRLNKALRVLNNLPV